MPIDTPADTIHSLRRARGAAVVLGNEAMATNLDERIATIRATFPTAAEQHEAMRAEARRIVADMARRMR